MHRVGGDDGILDVQDREQACQHPDLVRLRADGDLADNDAGALAQPGQQMHQAPVASRAPRTVLPSQAITRRPPIVLVRNHIHAPATASNVSAGSLVSSQAGEWSPPTAIGAAPHWCQCLRAW